MQPQKNTTIALPCQRAALVGDFLEFLEETRVSLKQDLVSERDSEVQQIRDPLEEHYLDDRGKPAMYQRAESALYDDSRQLVTLWRMFDRIDRSRLEQYRRLLKLELQGLTGDCHPRKVFDRSPFGIGAVVVGTITIWMTFVKNITGEDLSDLLELTRFNWIAGSVWIVGLFVVLWFILKTLRNNRQVAFLASIDRALTIFLDETPQFPKAAG